MVMRRSWKWTFSFVQIWEFWWPSWKSWVSKVTNNTQKRRQQRHNFRYFREFERPLLPVVQAYTSLKKNVEGHFGLFYLLIMLVFIGWSPEKVCEFRHERSWIWIVGPKASVWYRQVLIFNQILNCTWLMKFKE
jgi:hypothetical protein